MAVQFGCKKFHYYTYRKSITIETDHKPLETIFRKTLDEAPITLQKILMEVMTYNPILIYEIGSDMHTADILSHDCNSKYENLCRQQHGGVFIMELQPNERFSLGKQETEQGSTM